MIVWYTIITSGDKGENKMTRDYFKRITTEGYTAEDIGYASFKRGHETQIKKMIKRRARRIDKLALNKQFSTK